MDRFLPVLPRIMFEGIPTYPDAGRFWDIVDKYKVNIFYTAPTAIRSLMGFGIEPLKNKSLTSLQVLGTVGEPINEEAWHWYDEHIGKNKCPIVDTWWQTETGGIMISNLAGISPGKPSYATLPLPGVIPLLVDEKGNTGTRIRCGKRRRFSRGCEGRTGFRKSLYTFSLAIYYQNNLW